MFLNTSFASFREKLICDKCPFPYSTNKVKYDILVALMNTPSSFAAAGNAWARTHRLLFKPFDIGRWFVIGFSAWLAMMGKGGGGNFPDMSNVFDSEKANVGNELQTLAQELQTLLLKPWVIGLIVAIVTFSFLLGILFCWLRSRGDFMFVHHLYQPKSSIKDCWQRSKQHANSLFQWRILFFLIALGFLAFEGYLLWKQLISPFIRADYEWSPSLAMPLFIHIALLIVILIALQVIILFLKDFVVPIMYWQNCSASTAWTSVLALCNQHPFSVIGYLLCLILWAFLGGLAIVLVLLCTCCIALIPLVLPYISAVVMLPYTLFLRAYPIYFLSQWRPDLVPAPAEEATQVVIDMNVGPTPPILT